jgi:hypothetical protein
MSRVIPFVAIVALATLGGVVLAGVFSFMTPKPWPMTQGTLKATKVKVEGRDYVMVDGEGINQLGQMQSIAMDFDDIAKKIVVNRYLTRWNPFTKITVNNQWPVIFPLEGLKGGKYSVVYTTKQGEAVAGTVEVPVVKPGATP